MDVIYSTPADITNPAEGYGTLFFNTLDGNKLYSKDHLGVFTPVGVGTSDGEKRALDMVEDTMEGVLCALKTGNITMTEFNAFIAAGVKVTITDNGTGDITILMTTNVA